MGNQDVGGSENQTPIPREEWNTFLNSYSLKHDGWIANIEISGIDGQAESKTEVREQEFSGISFDRRGSGGERVEISFLGDESRQITHAVPTPTSIALAGSTADDLIIQSHDGTTTRLRFVRAVNPGKPSGLAA